MTGAQQGSPGFIARLMRRAYTFMSSSWLALFLLVSILVSCIAGVTFFRGEPAWRLIFSTGWFNGLLALLVANVTFSFIGRMRKRKLTLISLGILLFHLTFLVIFMGVVYNSMFYFHGNMRLTEGEVLDNRDLMSYDYISHGRFFDPDMLSGQTRLNRMVRGFEVGGQDKLIAYDIQVGADADMKQGLVYITNHLDYNGFRYIRDREGYSILVTLYDNSGQPLYSAFVPLQSLWMTETKTYLYTSGTRFAPGSFPFPYPPASPLFDLQVAFYPSIGEERGGEASFVVWPLTENPETYVTEGADIEQRETELQAKLHGRAPMAEGRAAMGELFSFGDYMLSLMEVRYWVGMEIRYDPGYPIILSSLWIGLGGIIIVFIGRLRQRRERRAAA